MGRPAAPAKRTSVSWWLPFSQASSWKAWALLNRLAAGFWKPLSRLSMPREKQSCWQQKAGLQCLTSLLYVAHCLGCCVSHVVLACFVAICCVAHIVWAALCQTHVSLILFGLLCAATPVWGPECIVETSLKLYEARNVTSNMGACLQHRKVSVDAMQCRHDDTGQLYYNLEYTVKSPQFFRHNVSVYAARCASAVWRKCINVIPV